jgi:hypothetical protein
MLVTYKMVKKTVKEVIFFVLALFLFYIAGKIAVWWGKKPKVGMDVSLGIMAIVYALCLAAVYYVTGMNKKNEGFEITPGARCRGGPYMWQGDSETAKMCRGMAQSEEGRCAIASQSCPNGYVGTPELPFEYTPLSDSKWQNARCKGPNHEKCQHAGLCAMNSMQIIDYA